MTSLPGPAARSVRPHRAGRALESALRPLVVLVQQALDASGPRFAVAGGIGGLRLDTSRLDDTRTGGGASGAGGPTARHRPDVSGGRRPDEPEPSDDTVEDDHVAGWELVRAAQAGDGEAFGRLYDRYVDSVFRFIYYRVNDRALAEDFTSETFLRALRRIGSFSYQGRDVGAWFVTIARNIVLDHVKSARHRLEVVTADTVEPRESANGPTPEAAVLDTLRTERLMSAVRELGDEQRECVTLRFMHGLSVAETASAMGKNEGAIKALQHRAVRKLADLVGAELA